MSVTKLAEWLNGNRDYDEGCQLYHDFGHDCHSQSYYIALKKSLSGTNSPDKLFKAILEAYKHFWNDGNPENETSDKAEDVSPKSKARVSASIIHESNLNKKDRLLDKLNAQLLEYYQNMGSRWKPALHKAKTDDERYEIQIVMDRMETNMRELLNTIDYVQEHGKLPERKKRESVMTAKPNTAKAAMEYMNVQKYVSYYTRKIERHKNALIGESDNKILKKMNRMLDKWELKLRNYKRQLEELEKLVHEKK